MAEEQKPTKKRRTPEELKAFYAKKIADLDQEDKLEVIRLLAGVVDDLTKVTTYNQHAPVKAEVAAAQAQAKAALAKLGLK
jgi:hypothetical protein